MGLASHSAQIFLLHMEGIGLLQLCYTCLQGNGQCKLG
jgi:hypothetical protein